MNHYIIIKFHNGITNQDGLCQDIAELFARSTDIDGIRQVHVHKSSIDLPNRHDLMIHMEMEPQALPIFDGSEIHRLWKERYAGYLVSAGYSRNIFSFN